MKINHLTFIGFALNGALGTGRYDRITIEDAKKHIDDGTIFQFLEKQLGDEFDISLFSPEQLEGLVSEWQDLTAIAEDRKLLVENGGLCLLVAYIFEGINRRLV